MNFSIRKAIEKDSAQIWALMQDLAIFENYIQSFAITPEIVLVSGFRKMPPDFYCFVAEVEEQVVGMLVYYYLPYTAQNKRTIYMKELFVQEKHRGQKIGEHLMNALKTEATFNNCVQIKWGVATWNEQGIKFYNRLGASENKDWLNFEINV